MDGPPSEHGRRVLEDRGLAGLAEQRRPLMKIAP